MRQKYIVLSVIVFAFSALSAFADADFGFNGDWSKTENANSGDWGVGARADFGGAFRGMIAFDYFFQNADDFFDEGDFTEEDLKLKFWELNANVIYEFQAEIRPYLGGGVGIARRTFDDANDIFDDERTELGLNVLGGIKFGDGPVKPFVEARGTFYPDDDSTGNDFGDRVQFGDRFIISAGILF